MSVLRQFLRGFQIGLGAFGSNITVLVNSLLLSMVYLAGVGITSIIARFVGKRFLDVELSKNRSSYWSDLGLEKRSIEDYYRQF